MKIVILILLSFLICSCTYVREKSNDNPATNNSGINVHTNAALTPEQQSAFDALNTLQINTDEIGRLYSSFPKIDQPCYPADTSFIISQSELLIAMMQFVKVHCRSLPREQLYNGAALTP